MTKARWLLPLLTALGACEVLVSDKLDVVHCDEEGAVGRPACNDGQVCKDHECVAAPPGALGRACASDADCAGEGFCYDPAAAGASGTKLCTRGCCASSDCDPTGDFVCWTDPRGLDVCRDAMDVGRVVPGKGAPLARCSGPSECRSGRCEAGACIDTCCSDTNCTASKGVCAFGNDGGTTTWTCAPEAPMKLAAFQPCKLDGDCETGLCTSIAGTLRCSVPCCSSKDCLFSDGMTSAPLACREVKRADGWARACSGEPVTGTKVVGDACLHNDDCRSALCMADAQGQNLACSDLCCTDDSCGDPARFACRPVSAVLGSSLRCASK